MDCLLYSKGVQINNQNYSDWLIQDYKSYKVYWLDQMEVNDSLVNWLIVNNLFIENVYICFEKKWNSNNKCDNK
jgi:hypothetical protein